jgi:hypothetical protein
MDAGNILWLNFAKKQPQSMTNSGILKQYNIDIFLKLILYNSPKNLYKIGEFLNVKMG